MAPLKNADIEQFRKYIFDSGVLQPQGTYFDVIVEDQGRFGSVNDEQFSVLPNPLNLDQLKWKTSAVFDQSSKGAKQYSTEMFYDFQASVLYAYKKLNIAPSYWHMYECQPKTEQSGDALFNSDGTVKEWSKITFQSGVCDESCYGKQASINGKCRTTCKKSTYGNDILIKEGNSLDANQLKQRLVNFGPVLTSSLTEGTRVYYGWNADGFMYLTRDAEGVLKQEQEETLGSFTKYILAYQFIDCQKDLKATTAKEDCPCPETQDKEYKTDPRTKEGGICAVKPPTPVPGPVVVGASGSIRAFWAVIATALLLPLLTTF